MEKGACGYTDSTTSCDRIISFTSRASDDSSKDLAAEVKACLTFFEETIESINTEDDAQTSPDAQSSGDRISKSHEDSSRDLSAELTACLQLLDEAIDSIEDECLDAKTLPESRWTINKQHYINEIKNNLDSRPLVRTTTNSNTPPKHGMATFMEKTPPNKVSRPRSDDATYWAHLPQDNLLELCTTIKSSLEKTQPFTHGHQKHYKKNQNILERCSSKRTPPALAPKPTSIPPHIAILKKKGSPNPESTSPENCSLERPDKVKLEVVSKRKLDGLSKLAQIKKDITPETERGLGAALTSSFPAWPQKDQLEKAGTKLKSSVSRDE